MNAPIRIRMTASYVTLLAVILAGVSAFVILRLRADLTGTVDRSLVPASDQVAQGYAIEGPKDFRDVGRTVLAGERGAAQVLSAGGGVVIAYGDAVGGRPVLTHAELARVLAGTRLTATRTLAGTDFRLAARPADRKGQRVAVVAMESLSPVQRSVRRVLLLLLLAVPVALLVTAAAGWWLALRALRPIARITTTAGTIGPQRLADRIDVPRTQDEVAQLAATLNTMLARIQRGAQEQQRLVADASHELRTPLTAMRTEVDVSLRRDELTPAAREVLESVRDEVDHLNATIEDLLTLATADEGGLVVDDGPVDLRALARETVARAAGHADLRDVRLALEGDDAVATGDAARLAHVLRNLLDNAIKFSPPHGRVMVTTWTDGETVGVSVEDEGPGIPPELRRRVFDRFYRVDPSRTRATGGSGLGLAIAEMLVQAHGGTILVDDDDPTRAAGSRFTVRLPSDHAGARGTREQPSPAAAQ